MGKIEARKSRRSKRPSATRKKRVATKRNKITIANPIIEAKWDKKQTLKQNYERLGLLADPTKTLMPKAKAKSEEAVHVDEIGGEAPKTKLIEELEEYSKLDTKKETHMAPGEVAIMKALIAKHGDDFKAMARDIKLNTYQHTPKQLQRKVEKYLASRPT